MKVSTVGKRIQSNKIPISTTDKMEIMILVIVEVRCCARRRAAASGESCACRLMVEESAGYRGSVNEIARNCSAKNTLQKRYIPNLSVLSVFSSVKVWFLAGSVFASAPLHACGSGYGRKSPPIDPLDELDHRPDHESCHCREIRLGLCA